MKKKENSLPACNVRSSVSFRGAADRKHSGKRPGGAYLLQ